VADHNDVKQSSTDSKERAPDVVEVCATDRCDGTVLLIDGSMLAIYDGRHRCIARITDLVPLTKALLEAQKVIMPVDEVIASLRKQLAMSSVAGDMWNELENLREHWEGTERAVFVQEWIDRYEELAGLK
jgi:hypothetical protein